MSLQSHDHVERLKHNRRPRKSEAERNRRLKAQKKRLIALGVPQEEADKLSPLAIRTKLLRPKKVVKELAKRAAKQA